VSATGPHLFSGFLPDDLMRFTAPTLVGLVAQEHWLCSALARSSRGSSAVRCLSPGPRLCPRHTVLTLSSYRYQGRYNIISWDPRSVNLTSPALDCFENAGDANRFQRDVEHTGLSFGA